jgi:protein-disulfide isomerase
VTSAASTGAKRRLVDHRRKSPEAEISQGLGNPNAKVKLVEFGSLTCPHCAEFEHQGGKALVDNYVKKGLVSWEFRNFVRDPLTWPHVALTLWR